MIFKLSATYPISPNTEYIITYNSVSYWRQVSESLNNSSIVRTVSMGIFSVVHTFMAREHEYKLASTNWQEWMVELKSRISCPIVLPCKLANTTHPWIFTRKRLTNKLVRSWTARGCKQRVDWPKVQRNRLVFSLAAKNLLVDLA